MTMKIEQCGNTHQITKLAEISTAALFDE